MADYWSRVAVVHMCGTFVPSSSSSSFSKLCVVIIIISLTNPHDHQPSSLRRSLDRARPEEPTAGDKRAPGQARQGPNPGTNGKLSDLYAPLFPLTHPLEHKSDKNRPPQRVLLGVCCTTTTSTSPGWIPKSVPSRSNLLASLGMSSAWW